MKRLLCLSNGHGEDTIAVVLLEALRAAGVEVMAIPIVGEGRAYHQHQIPIVGPTQSMPSGGFIYMDARQLWDDIQSGLGGLTLAQYQAMQAIVPTVDGLIAVGDIVVQIFARLSGKPYVFVGTAKSDYYLGGKPSVFGPWERWLMGDSRCLAVYPRDRVTTLNLQKLGVPRAYDLGNPMMDGLEPRGFDLARLTLEATQTLILLLPGSRPPEAYRNLLHLLTAREELGDLGICATAMTGSLQTVALEESLEGEGWTLTKPAADLWQVERGGPRTYLAWGAFADLLHRADLVLAMTGTATEQAVGLGKPVMTFVGSGPQFTYRFAEAQTRLLGPSISLVLDVDQTLPIAQQLLTDRDLPLKLQANGRERMGTVGAAQRITKHMLGQWVV